MNRKGNIISVIILLLAFMPAVKAQQKTLSRDEAEQVRVKLISEWLSNQAGLLKQNDDTHCISQGDLRMRYDMKVYGDEPADGRSLWISMHGGGNAPTALNDSQWENQKRLYQPDEGIYVAPRAPWDDWDMWFKPPIDSMFDELIRTMVVLHHVNPNKVYLLGYSAGGDGVWRMAPRMADRWAAASMMAGHPGDVNLLSLRNLPFMIWCGGDDAAYNRNRVDAERGIEMDSLQQADPQGYIHETHILPGKPHWMDLEDKAALPWMAKHQRNPYPKTVVWVQGDRGHKHFYWLSVPEEEAKKGAELRVSVRGNTITIHSEDYTSVTLYLNDSIVDLNKLVVVKWGKQTAYKGRLPRTEENMRTTLNQRGDLAYCFPSQLTVKRTLAREKY
jgi:poly(3-hydroxybutyrate) depolymerase